VSGNRDRLLAVHSLPHLPPVHRPVLVDSPATPPARLPRPVRPKRSRSSVEGPPTPKAPRKKSVGPSAAERHEARVQLEGAWKVLPVGFATYLVEKGADVRAANE
jgi:hypothetical protein